MDLPDSKTFGDATSSTSVPPMSEIDVMAYLQTAVQLHGKALILLGTSDVNQFNYNLAPYWHGRVLRS